MQLRYFSFLFFYILLKRDPWAKKSLVMTLAHPPHPTNFLSAIGDSLDRYLIPTSFNNNNPHPNNFLNYIRSMYVQNNSTNVRFVLNIVKSKSQRENHG